MKIIAFTGMPCSGKSVAVEIAKDLGIPVIRMGDAVWEETENRGLSLTDEHVGNVANEMRQKHGMDVWAQKTVEKIESLGSPECIVIDGVRNSEEIAYFYNSLGTSFVVIAIRASEYIRQQRALYRKRVDDASNPEDLKQRDEREIRWGLNEVITNADIEIVNEGTLDEFTQTVKEIFQVFEMKR